MQKRLFLLIVFSCMIALCSCVSPKDTVASQFPTFAEQMLEFGKTEVKVSGQSVQLLDNVQLPDGQNIIIDGGTWKLDLNGNELSGDVDSLTPIIDIHRGKLVIADSSSDRVLSPGSLSSYNGIALGIGSAGSAEINGGEVWGSDYACVLEGGALTVNGGYVAGGILPISTSGSAKVKLSGGILNAYDPSYEAYIQSGKYLSSRIPDNVYEFANEWDNPCTILRKGTYGGTSYLTLESPIDSNACFRLYRTYQADSFQGSTMPPSYQWFVPAGQDREVSFTSGGYVLKVGEGDVWTDAQAYGPDGNYWFMDPYEFESDFKYSISQESGEGMSNGDSQEGFLAGI